MRPPGKAYSIWKHIAIMLRVQCIEFAGTNGNAVYHIVMPPHLRVAANEETGPDTPH